VDEAVPPAQCAALPRARGVLEIEVAIDGHRVVQGRQHRPTVFDELGQAGAERLVVVHDIEVGAPAPEEPPYSEAERVRLGKSGGAPDAELGDVDSRLELPGARKTERVLGAGAVEAPPPL